MNMQRHIKRITNCKLEDGKLRYCVKWESTWVDADVLVNHQSFIDEFWECINQCNQVGELTPAKKRRYNSQNKSKAKKKLITTEGALSKLEPALQPTASLFFPPLAWPNPVDAFAFDKDANNNYTILSVPEEINPQLLAEALDPMTAKVMPPKTPTKSPRGRGRGRKTKTTPVKPGASEPLDIMSPNQVALSVAHAQVPSTPAPIPTTPVKTPIKSEVKTPVKTPGKKEKSEKSAVASQMSPKELENLIATWDHPHVKLVLLCRVCDKEQKSSKPQVWQAHFLIHSDVKPFRCPTCDRGFVQGTSYKNHLKTHEKKALVAKTETGAVTEAESAAAVFENTNGVES